MSERPRVIAEIGINHNGQPELARALIDAAANAGVYGIKFQYRDLSQIYVSQHREIGDEILIEQIERNYLSPATICDLANHARSRGVLAGISFFNRADVDSFDANHELFSFFKVPSAELTNMPLIERLCSFGRSVYISTGGHGEMEIESVFSALQSDNWTPLHCISNYPTLMVNAKLGYLSWLRSRWNRPVGYSSHDANFEVCLLAMHAGASVIERHITLDKAAPGLDHSSSSTPNEFETICQFATAMTSIVAGRTRREANQGERMNIQNLGRSFYFNRTVRSGEQLQSEDLVYRSPKVSIDCSAVNKFMGEKLLRTGRKNEPITQGHIDGGRMLPATTAAFARGVGLGVPVRLHDFVKFQRLFDVRAFEFHLSYGEALGSLVVDNLNPSNAYSIHLPDYISSDYLIDVFAEDESRRGLSCRIIEATAGFADRLQDLTGKEVPIVGSFSEVHGSKDTFYARHREYFDGFAGRGLRLVPQWLPPIAWYFGGSVPLSVFNSEEDMEFIANYQYQICLDVSHFLLGANYYGFDKVTTLAKLLPLTGHIHIADSLGIDGEGMQIGEGDPENLPIILRLLKEGPAKIVEVWQGHLDDGRKVVDAMERLEAAFKSP